MALLKRPLNISFNHGIDKKSDPKQVIAGKLLTLENCTLQTTGEITKRNGNVTLNSPLTIGNALDTYKDELVAMDGVSLYSFSAEEQTFDRKGSKVACDISTVPVIRNAQNQTNPDSATIAGLTCYVWQQYDPSLNNATQGVYASVFDNVTGQCITSNLAISGTAINPKVKALGTVPANSTFVITYAEGTNLVAVTIDVTNPHGLGFTATVLATGINVLNYDVTRLGNLLYVAYQDNSSNIKTFTVNSNLAISAVTTITQDCGTWVSISADTTLNQLWYSSIATDLVTLRYSVYSNTFVQVLAPLIADTGTAGILFLSVTSYASNGSGFLIYESQNPSFAATGLGSFPAIKQISVTNAGVLGTATSVIRGLKLFSKPLVYNGTVYIVTFFPSPIQPTFFVIDLNAHIISKLNYSQSSFLIGATGITGGRLVEVNSLSSSEFQFPAIQQDLVLPVTSAENTINSTNLNYPSTFAQTGIISYTLNFTTPLVAEEIGNGLEVSGGIVSLYDGTTVAELGFNVYPEIEDIAKSIQGGIAPGNYDYKVVYEWVDNFGQTHRSAPSIPAAINNSVVTQNLGVHLVSGSTSVILSAAVQNLYIGMPISGANIPANTTIANVFGDGLGRINLIVMSNAATLTVVETAVVTNQISFHGTVATDSNQVIVDPIYKGIYQVGHYQTSNVEYFFNNTRGVMVGMSIVSGSTDATVNGKISVLQGDLVITDVPVASGGGTEFILKNRIFGTITNGSNTITAISAADIARIAPLMLVDPNVVGPFATGTTVSGVGNNFITMSTNATTNGTHVDLEMPDSSYNLWDGEVVTGANIPAGTQISSTNDLRPSRLNFNDRNIFLDENATGNASSELITVNGVWGTRIVVDTLRLTEKSTQINIILYRTLNNGTQYFRSSSVTVPPVNNTNVDYIYLYDNLPDTSIQGNEQLYTNGGVLDNIGVPASTLLTLYQNRLLAVPSESPNSFWYSQQVIPGDPVEFSDALVWNVDSRGGAITAFHQMDSNLIIFKKNTIFYMNGSGPSPNGTGNDFTNPLLISTDSGCIDPKSLVIMPMGLMYKSLKGIYLLKRDLSVVYIGADVEEFNSSSITSVLVIEKLNQIRFTLDSGITLVYDYYVNQWYVFTNIAANDSVNFQDFFTYIKSDGSIFQENENLYTDNGAFIAMKVVTGWFSFAGIQGFERIYKFMVLGEYKSPHTLNVSFAYDFLPATTQTTPIPVLSDPGVYQYRIFPQRMKCETLQVTLEETQSAAFGQGLSISGLGMEVGLKQGLNKLPASQSYG